MSNTPDFIIKQSTIRGAGKGLFTQKDIKKGTRLGEYKGKKVSEKRYLAMKDTSYCWEVDTSQGSFYIDAKKVIKNNPLRYINGAMTKIQKKKVNVESYQYNKKIFYRTIRNIKAGTELIIDYGDEFFL